MHRKIMVICPHLPSPTGSGSIDNSGFGVQNQQEPDRNELNIFYTPPGMSLKAGRSGPTRVCINFIPRRSTSASQQGGNAHLFFSVSAMRFTAKLSEAGKQRSCLYSAKSTAPTAAAMNAGRPTEPNRVYRALLTLFVNTGRQYRWAEPTRHSALSVDPCRQRFRAINGI